MTKISRRQLLLNGASLLAATRLLNAATQTLVNQETKAVTRIIPFPKYIKQHEERMILSNGHIFCGDTRKELLAAELLINEARKVAGTETLRKVKDGGQSSGAPICLVDWSHDSQLKTEVTSNLDEEDRYVLSDAERTGQSYVLRMDPKKQLLIVAGSGPMGVLYGATSLIQVLGVEKGNLVVPVVQIRDFPDFKYRAAADWLLFAEINRWAYDWGDGKKAFVRRIKRKLDFCLKYKINVVFFDGFGWHDEKFPGYASMMRELNQYARERGIKLLFGGYGANTQPKAIRPEHNIGTVWENRSSYPDGEIYPCFGQENIPGPFLGTCRANEDLNRLKSEEMERFVRTVEPGALYIHHEDRGVGTAKWGDPHEDELWRTWKKRDERCRSRWPNDDLLAKDGEAGAVAHGYQSYLNAILKVKNSDSGFDASEDCEVIFISPGYNPIPTDQQDWNNHLQFWSNVLSLMPAHKNLSIGFREIFPQQGTNKRWVDAYKEQLKPLKLNSRMFFFFLGGGDHYRNNYPFVATPIMNGLFNGGDTIYNFSGAVHQEPLQLLNAEFSWNAQAPGHRIPSTYEEARSLWEALSENRETPEEIFGADGFLNLACQKIYGSKAGLAIARFTTLFELQPSLGGQLLVPNFPEKLFPLSVMWGIVSRDEASWELEISDSRTLSILQKLKITPEDWQMRLSPVWSIYSKVTDRGIEIIHGALRSPDLKEEAREDLKYLLKCLEVGKRFASLLASYHETLAHSGKRQQDKMRDLIKQSQGKWQNLSHYLDSNFTFDTVCPLGGDQASWQEGMEKIRSKLQQLANQV